MRVVEYDRFGDASVLEVRDRPTPQPRAGEVLVRVHAAALNPKDLLIRSGKLRLGSGTKFPKRVGYDWAGVVEQLGPGVTEFKPGDEVFGMINAWSAGAVAEQLAAGMDELALKPARLSFEEAASLPLAGLTALQALRMVAHVKPGQTVLVNGASGGVGTLAIQLAKILGAKTLAFTSAKNAELVRGLGADEVLDYAQTDPTRLGREVDVFFDVFGNFRFEKARRVLTPTGTFISTVLKPHVFAAHLRTLMFSPQRARLVVVKSGRRDLQRLAAWAQEGKLKPVIDRVVPMDAIADAQRHVGTRRARGKVVIRVCGEGGSK